MPGGGQGPRETVLLGIAVIVAAVWTIASLVQVADPGRQVPTYVNLTMAAVVGFFFGAGAIQSRRKRNGNGNGGGEEDA